TTGRSLWRRASAFARWPRLPSPHPSVQTPSSGPIVHDPDVQPLAPNTDRLAAIPEPAHQPDFVGLWQPARWSADLALRRDPDTHQPLLRAEDRLSPGRHPASLYRRAKPRRTRRRTPPASRLR